MDTSVVRCGLSKLGGLDVVVATLVLESPSVERNRAGVQLGVLDAPTVYDFGVLRICHAYHVESSRIESLRDIDEGTRFFLFDFYVSHVQIPAERDVGLQMNVGTASLTYGEPVSRASEPVHPGPWGLRGLRQSGAGQC